MNKNSLFIRMLLVCKPALQHLCFKKWAICLALILSCKVSFASEELKKAIEDIRNNPSSSEELNKFKPSELIKHPERTIKHIYALERIMFFSSDAEQRLDAEQLIDPEQWKTDAEQRRGATELMRADAGLLRKIKPQGDMQEIQRMVQEGKLRSTEDYNQYRRAKSISTRLGPRMVGALKGFPLEAIVFYAAIGASMWTKDLSPRFATLNPGVQNGREDPQWVDTWVPRVHLSIGVFSFLCFVLTSNVTQYAYTQA